MNNFIKIQDFFNYWNLAQNMVKILSGFQARRSMKMSKGDSQRHVQILRVVHAHVLMMAFHSLQVANLSLLIRILASS